ncbi:MCE family protein [Rhodococcus sp. MEB064]|uniref:MCE family protein n=1 Tax=Rhodococcus sp. MEB064 TaxID=1587522 RepID=UPI0005AC5D33|nr:MCE family protein [Rhodococcus sp. MEB064]
MTRRLVGVVLFLVVAATASYAIVPRFTSVAVTAEFANTTGLYVGDDVRLMGVTIGSVTSIEPRGDHAEVGLRYDSSYSIPADAKAVIVSQSVVASRFVQLAPAYDGGDTLRSADTIPLDRTAVPVEWDRITEQLARVSETLAPQGPTGPDSVDAARPLGALVDAVDANIGGRGQDIRTTLTQLSDAMRTLSDGRTDLYSLVRNLQVFVSALAASDQQIVTFNETMASVTSVLADDQDEIGSALASLDGAVSDVERFVRENRTGVATALGSLEELTAELASQRDGIAQILHVAPTALSNLNNIYQPAHNAIVSSLAPNNFANPMDFVCSAIAAAEQVGAQEGAESCVRYLGPLLKTLAFDYLPLQANPIKGVGALPGQIVDSEGGR